MLPPQIVGFSGNPTRPSKTRTFVSHAVEQLCDRYGLTGETFDITDLGASFRTANGSGDLEPSAKAVVEAVVGADLLVVGSPTYKGGYTGLFKHFFDLIDPIALRGKPVLITATGGGDRHALVVEHQLRPLFGFFEATTLSTAIYTIDRDFVDGRLSSAAIVERTERAIAEAGRLLGRGPVLAAAAE